MMATKNCLNKTVALVDWNWMGHHPTFFTDFASAIAEAKSEVVPFCADPEDFLTRLGKLSLRDEVCGRIHPSQRIFGPQESSFRPARWRKHYQALRFFRGLGRRLRRWEALHGRKIDLVFFACIYDSQFDFFRVAERQFGYPWAGLYLHARSFRMPGSPIPYTGGLPCPEKIFSSPLLKAVAVLDEVAVEPLVKITDGKPVLVFPDITLEALPAGGVESGLARKIKAFAAGRPIVSLTGHLQWTKGFDVFTAAAGHPAMQEVFFFLAGEINWSEISPAERERMERAWEELPNMLCHFQHLPEETMNAIYAVSDVVVAAYRAFPNSSNALTKAAVFQRPIIVSDGYLMAERVRDYCLGEVIPEGDIEALVAALYRMLQDGYHEELSGHARWQEYREAHSVQRLIAAFSQLLTII